MMKKISLIFIGAILMASMACPREAGAIATTREEEGVKDKSITDAQKAVYMKRHTPTFVKKLVTDLMAGVTQGFDSNVNLDWTKKSDCYTQESLDMRFKYPVIEKKTDLKFGTDVTNITYYKITDASMFDWTADATVEHKLLDNFYLLEGYLFEMLWYPRDENGTFVMNEFNTGFKHYVTPDVYEKFLYKAALKNYTSKKMRFGNGNLGSDLREDLRNTFNHELGIYLFDTTKIRIVNEFFFNKSNDQYMDFYTYNQYRFNPSIVQMLTKRLYNITSFALIHKVYEGRLTSESEASQKDNLYVVSTSLQYDLTKAITIYATYSYRENDTNEPLDSYTDNMYTAGLYYTF